MLIDGHLRKELAADSKVPVLVLDVTEAEADLILATHDPLTSMAETDQALLDELVQGLDIENDETQKMLDELASDPVIDVVEDEVPEVPDEPTTKVGDLFDLGDHRLLCGDATSAEDVSRLMDGAKADLLLTDPPYGIGYAGSMKLGEERFGWKQYAGGWDEERPSDTTILECVAYCEHAIIWGANFFPCLPISAGWLVWNKIQRNFSMGEGEFAWTSFLNSVRIFDLARGSCLSDGKQHPTQKAIALFAWCIDLCKESTTILDPFLGSGTTLIAAEQLGRKCYGMEISPAYCDVIIQRWENLTGKKAKKVK
jgi:DNA modification methylase